MSDQTVVTYCAPTLAGIKTANLFSYPWEGRESLMQDLDRMNRVLRKKDIRVLFMGRKKNRALIYMYRPGYLARDLKREETAKILRNLGYPVESPEGCVSTLYSHLNAGGRNFPHEIGCFLGYPPEDVMGFIRHKAKDYVCRGEWKVYGDREKAIRTFRKYEACTRDYERQLACGKSLEYLAVKVNEGESSPEI